MCYKMLGVFIIKPEKLHRLIQANYITKFINLFPSSFL